MVHVAVGSDAVGSAKRDKSNYQMDPSNGAEALREVSFGDLLSQCTLLLMYCAGKAHFC